MNERRLHPFTVLRFLRKTLVVYLLPLVQVLFERNWTALHTALRQDALLFLLLCAVSWGILHVSSWSLDDTGVFHLHWRLGILKEHGLKLQQIQETIAKIDPMPGAKEFLDELRSISQVIIISDTFSQFAGPLMKKLGYPTIFCNELIVADDGEITGFKMRCPQSKLTTVKALQSIGYDTIASGDSHNDLGMIYASKAGFLFKSTDQIKADNPDLEAFETYDELLAAIKKAMD